MPHRKKGQLISWLEAYNRGSVSRPRLQCKMAVLAGCSNRPGETRNLGSSTQGLELMNAQ